MAVEPIPIALQSSCGQGFLLILQLLYRDIEPTVINDALHLLYPSDLIHNRFINDLCQQLFVRFLHLFETIEVGQQVALADDRRAPCALPG